MYVAWWHFHQHFTHIFCTNILAPKIYKAARKLLVKLTTAHSCNVFQLWQSNFFHEDLTTTFLLIFLFLHRKPKTTIVRWEEQMSILIWNIFSRESLTWFSGYCKVFSRLSLKPSQSRIGNNSGESSETSAAARRQISTTSQPQNRLLLFHQPFQDQFTFKLKISH